MKFIASFILVAAFAANAQAGEIIASGCSGYAVDRDLSVAYWENRRLEVRLWPSDDSLNKEAYFSVTPVDRPMPKDAYRTRFLLANKHGERIEVVFGTKNHLKVTFLKFNPKFETGFGCKWFGLWPGTDQ